MNYIVSHNDLDGYAASTLFSQHYLFDGEQAIFNVGYDQVNNLVLNLIERKPNSIVILDISVNEEVAKKLNEAREKEGIYVELIDHHKTAEWLNQYEWADVEVEKDGKLTSATELVAERIKGFTSISGAETNEKFASIVTSYDTWAWKNDPNDGWKEKAKEFNDFMYLIGKDKWVELMLERDFDVNLKEEDLLLLEVDKNRANEYAEDCLNHRTVGFIFTDNKFSTVCITDAHMYVNDVLMKAKEHGDIAININRDKVSLRSDVVDVSEIAKKMGGGGHKAAAGFGLEKPLLKEDLLDKIRSVVELKDEGV